MNLIYRLKLWLLHRRYERRWEYVLARYPRFTEADVARAKNPVELLRGW